MTPFNPVIPPWLAESLLRILRGEQNKNLMNAEYNRRLPTRTNPGPRTHRASLKLNAEEYASVSNGGSGSRRHAAQAQRTSSSLVGALIFAIGVLLPASSTFAGEAEGNASDAPGGNKKEMPESVSEGLSLLASWFREIPPDQFSELGNDPISIVFQNYYGTNFYEFSIKKAVGLPTGYQKVDFEDIASRKSSFRSAPYRKSILWDLFEIATGLVLGRLWASAKKANEGRLRHSAGTARRSGFTSGQNSGALSKRSL